MPQPSTTGGALMSYASTVDTGQVQPWVIDMGMGADGSAASGTLTANTVYMFPFELLANVTITGMRWRMFVTVTGTTDIGIYDSGGNLLAHTGTQVNAASQVQSANFASVLALSPGRYYMALCPSNSTDTYGRVGSMGPNFSIARNYTGATAGSSGVLPASAGALSTSAAMPVMEAIVSGGVG